MQLSALLQQFAKSSHQAPSNCIQGNGQTVLQACGCFSSALVVQLFVSLVSLSDKRTGGLQEPVCPLCCWLPRTGTSLPRLYFLTGGSAKNKHDNLSGVPLRFCRQLVTGEQQPQDGVRRRPRCAHPSSWPCCCYPCLQAAHSHLSASPAQRNVHQGITCGFLMIVSASGNNRHCWMCMQPCA